MEFNWIKCDSSISSLKKKRVILWVILIAVIVMELGFTYLHTLGKMNWPWAISLVVAFAVVALSDLIHSCTARIKKLQSGFRKPFQK